MNGTVDEWMVVNVRGDTLTALSHTPDLATSCFCGMRKHEWSVVARSGPGNPFKCHRKWGAHQRLKTSLKSTVNTKNIMKYLPWCCWLVQTVRNAQ